MGAGEANIINDFFGNENMKKWEATYINTQNKGEGGERKIIYNFSVMKIWRKKRIWKVCDMEGMGYI